MGVLGKILLIVAIAIISIWAYENVKIASKNVCITDTNTNLNITCLIQDDCVKYMTSQYGTYEKTPENVFILSQTTGCVQGKCVAKQYTYANTCNAGETPLTYKVTLKDYVAKLFGGKKNA